MGSFHGGLLPFSQCHWLPSLPISQAPSQAQAVHWASCSRRPPLAFAECPIFLSQMSKPCHVHLPPVGACLGILGSLQTILAQRRKIPNKNQIKKSLNPLLTACHMHISSPREGSYHLMSNLGLFGEQKRML